MRVHYLTHVPFEGLGAMDSHFKSSGFRLSHTPVFTGAPLPDINEVDWLVIMGGPMSVNETRKYPWLTEELSLIKAAIHQNKRVLGVCLGAQLMAKALGQPVYPGRYREIGWHPVSPQMPEASPWRAVFPHTTDVFHWHGETFDLPPGAEALVSSVGCQNQGFTIGRHVVALQFHLETTIDSAKALIANCAADLDDSLFVQSPEQMLIEPTRFETLNQSLKTLLSVMAQ